MISSGRDPLSVPVQRSCNLFVVLRPVMQLFSSDYSTSYGASSLFDIHLDGRS